MPPKTPLIKTEQNPDAYADAVQQNQPKPEDGYYAGRDFFPPFPTEAPEKPPFTIDSDGAADWLLAKLAALDAEADLLQRQHEQRMKQIQNDRQCLLNLFGSQLETFVHQKIKADRLRRKSVIFPHGTCGFRTVPAGLKVTDTAAAMEFAKEALPEAVRTVQTLDVIAYRQRAESRMHTDGELLPGTEWIGERESFSIKFGKDGK